MITEVEGIKTVLKGREMKLLNMILGMGAFLMASTAMAQEHAAAAASTGEWKSAAAALGIALAAFGGALGQAKAASAALEGIARNPAAAKGLFTPMIIALALIESLVLYALVVALKIS
jgi:F-type H+-transporting ATPase subunit c